MYKRQAVAYSIHKAISGSKFVVFEQSGHLPFYEEQEIFVQTVKEFLFGSCLLYTSDAADERSSVDLGGRRIIKKKQYKKKERKKRYMNNKSNS
mgnify:CR=1 FL=1